jgi:hypothetical protein
MSETPDSPNLYGNTAPPTKPEAPGLLDQLVGAFTEPTALFRRLRPSPSWLPALGLAVGISIVAMLIWASRVDMAEQVRHQMEMMRDTFKMNLPDQAVDDAIAKAEGSRPWFSAVLGPLFGIPFVYLVIALIVWAFAAMGRSEEDAMPTFPQAFSVTAVHNLVTLPGMLLAGVMCLLQPVGGRSVQQMAPTVLGFFVRPESMGLRGLAALVDPFWFFSFIVLAIGMRETLRTKTWAIAACLGVFALFGGLFRFLGGVMS